MFDYKARKLSPSIYQIADASYTSMFLVIGSERAALIDTGIGIKGLDTFIRTLTDLPLTVILTHGHLDHSGGSILFPEVYIHPADIPVIQANDIKDRLDYTKRMYQAITNAMNGPNAPEITITDEALLPYMLENAAPDKTYHELSDGMTFDLGGITIEIIEVPGHTHGSCCPLMIEERSILFGDACNLMTLLDFSYSTNISTYKKSLLHLKTYEDRYDTVYLSHGGPTVEKIVLDNNIALCDVILAGEDEKIPEMGMEGTKSLRAKKTNGWFEIDKHPGNIIYNESKRC